MSVNQPGQMEMQHPCSQNNSAAVAGISKSRSIPGKSNSNRLRQIRKVLSYLPAQCRPLSTASVSSLPDFRDMGRVTLTRYPSIMSEWLSPSGPRHAPANEGSRVPFFRRSPSLGSPDDVRIPGAARKKLRGPRAGNRVDSSSRNECL